MVYVEIRRKEFGGKAAVKDHMADSLWTPPLTCSQLGTWGAQGPPVPLQSALTTFCLSLCGALRAFSFLKCSLHKSPLEVRQREILQLGPYLGIYGKDWTIVKPPSSVLNRAQHPGSWG